MAFTLRADTTVKTQIVNDEEERKERIRYKAFSPTTGPMPSPKNKSGLSTVPLGSPRGRASRALMQGVKDRPPDRGYSTLGARAGQGGKKKGRQRSYSDLDSFKLSAGKAGDDEYYPELKQALEAIDKMKFFGPLTSQGFGDIETILQSDTQVLPAITGMTEEDALEIIEKLEEVLKETIKPEFDEGDLSDDAEMAEIMNMTTEDMIAKEIERAKSADDEKLSSAFQVDTKSIMEYADEEEKQKQNFVDVLKSIKDSQLRKVFTAALSRGFMLFDIVTDAIILLELIDNQEVGWSLIIFTSIVAPFIVVWSAGLRYISDKGWAELKAVYTFPFSGILLLVFFDLYLIFEAWILNPILFICTGKITDIAGSAEMHAYLRLKALAELFLENIPQIIIQAFIVLSGSGTEYGLDSSSIYLAVASALGNIAFMGFLLNKEAKDNEQDFLDFAMLTLQGRFGYTPFVSTISNGTTRYVDYMAMNQGLLRFNADALRKLNAACNAKHCRLERLKMGSTCEQLREDITWFHDTILWNLRDTCDSIGCEFTESISDEIIKTDGPRVLRKACEQGWDGLLHELLEINEPRMVRNKLSAKEKENAINTSEWVQETDSYGDKLWNRVDINDKDPESGQTAMMLGARHHHYVCVRSLLKHRLWKVDVDAQDIDGTTALIHAVTAAHIDDEIVRLLLTLGLANVNLADDEGRTALSHLCERDVDHAMGAIIVLLHTSRKKLDVNVADYHGMTPLMYACQTGNFDVVIKLLTRSDIDVRAKDNLGRSAFMHAVIENRKSIVSVFLKQKGKKSTIN